MRSRRKQSSVKMSSKWTWKRSKSRRQRSSLQSILLKRKPSLSRRLSKRLLKERFKPSQMQTNCTRPSKTSQKKKPPQLTIVPSSKLTTIWPKKAWKIQFSVKWDRWTSSSTSTQPCPSVRSKSTRWVKMTQSLSLLVDLPNSQRYLHKVSEPYLRNFLP
jgi:hypothetical protein